MIHAYLFEARGIQRYLFSTGKLRDLLAGSELIDQLCAPGGFLDITLAALNLQPSMPRRAGGTFYLLFDNEDDARRFRAAWRLACAQWVPGIEGVDALVHGDSNKAAIASGLEQLRESRNVMSPSLPRPGPLDARSARTGLGATVKDSGEHLDEATMRARKFARLDSTSGLEQRFFDRTGYSWPRSFEYHHGVGALFPLHKDRVVRYMIDRWNGGACFEVLDELCGIDGVTGNLFPEISPVKLFGADFENEDILHVEVDWLGTDGAQVVITYHREAHSRMVREREEAIERARAEAALRYPSLDEVLEGYKALRRTAWLPVFADGPGADMDSRYFGNPWMPNSEKWPTNANGIPLSFVLQINIEKLPGLMRERLGGTGVVAMFYDVDSEWNPQYTDEEPYERDAVLVLYDTNAEGSIRKGRTLEKEPQKVVSWRAVGDYPDTDDLMTEEFLPSRIAEFLKETRLDIGGCLSRKHGSPTPPETVRRFIDRTEELWGAGCCDFETIAGSSLLTMPPPT